MRNPSKPSRRFESEAELLRALAHPMRLRMLAGLSANPCNVSQLWQRLGISQPLASQHLRRLRQAGIVLGERRGQETCYRVLPGRARKILRQLGVES